MKSKHIFSILFIHAIFIFTFNSHAADSIELLNVSYDPTRDLYNTFNKMFVSYWKKQSGEEVTVNQSHGGSAKQARSVIDGLKADVVTLALAYDIDIIAEQTHLLSRDWQKQFPYNSCPYTSTILFLVRKNNPKHIKDWNDLIRSDVTVITPNPKTSGGARWNFLAAWAYASEKNHGDEKAAKDFMSRLYKNVPVLDTGARASATTFAQHEVGDVLISWENEAHLVINEFGSDKFEIVIPSISVLAEPPVAIVQKNTENNGTTKVAMAYLNYLYSKEAQELMATLYYRPSNQMVYTEHLNQFPKMRLLTIKEFGGWHAAQQKFFAEGAMFDEIYHQ